MADQLQTISAEKLCALTGLTDRRHRQLAKDGYFPPPLKGEYQLTATIQGMFKHYREAAQRAHRSFAEDKSTKTKREIELLELKIGQQQQALVPVAGVESMWAGVCEAIRQSIMAADIPLEAKDSICGYIQKIEPSDYIKHADSTGEEVSADD